MKKSFALFGGAALLAAALIAGPTQAKTGGSSTIACGDNGTISTTPTALWPPNHKDTPITFTYTDADGGDVSITTIANPHNEIVDGEEINGTGNTPAATDAVGGTGSGSDGTAVATGTARAERSGHKNDAGGRVYEFDYDASSEENGLPGEDDGCSSDVATPGDGIIVFVPHDCRDSACKP